MTAGEPTPGRPHPRPTLEEVALTTTTTPDPTPGQPTGERMPVADPLFTVAERQALGGFLAHYARTCAGPGWTTNPTPLRWTAMNSAPCSSPPDSARRRTTR